MSPPFELTPLIAWGAGSLLALGALATAAVALGKAGRRVLRIARTFDLFFREWFGEAPDEQRGKPRRPGIPERLGNVEKHMGRMCERLSEVDDRVQRVEHEMHPNSGSSLRDAVDDIRAQTRRPATPAIHQTFVTPADTDRLTPPEE